MPCAIVFHLKALSPGHYGKDTSIAVHGAWFSQWKAVDERFLREIGLSPWLCEKLHSPIPRPFTASPLLDLPEPDHTDTVQFSAGQRARVRFTILSEEDWVEPALHHSSGGWLANPPTQILVNGITWQVEGISEKSSEDPLAGADSYEELVRRSEAQDPPSLWKVEFLTPTAFSGEDHKTFPFPQPRSLIRSWLERWNAFCPERKIDPELQAGCREWLLLYAYDLKTRRLLQADREAVGCTGWAEYEALCPGRHKRQLLDALFRYAFYCGSGYKTAQGMGQTIPLLETPLPRSRN